MKDLLEKTYENSSSHEKEVILQLRSENFILNQSILTYKSDQEALTNKLKSANSTIEEIMEAKDTMLEEFNKIQSATELNSNTLKEESNS